MTKYKTDFISAGGNQHPSAADWDNHGSGLLAYGADRNVAIWNPNDDSRKGIQALLKGHEDIVTVLKFLPISEPSRSILLSGSQDSRIRVWMTDTSSPTGFRETENLEAHGKTMNAVATLAGSDIFVTSSAAPQVKVWQLQADWTSCTSQTRLLQTIDPQVKNFPLTLELAYLEPSENSVILAIGGTYHSIQVFVSDSVPNSFRQVATLTGHEAWIRSLAFTRESSKLPSSDLLLASASQDKYIRLWRIHKVTDLPISNDQASDESLRSLVKSPALSNKVHRFTCCANHTADYVITFEALLLGHEDWIYSVNWCNKKGELSLLSASADNTLAVWNLDEASGIWICSVRLGEFSAQKGATTATGSTGGYWIGLWSPNGDSVVSLGRTGSWRVWRRGHDAHVWTSDVAVSGHTKEVRDLAWARDGSYILSTGADQTTRLWARWQQNQSWHEFSRPQIHGYDLNCVDTLDGSRFVSGADEKPLRVFQEPKGVAEYLQQLCARQRRSQDTGSRATLPEAASIPVMGLSNKAVDEAEEQETPDINAETLLTNGDSAVVSNGLDNAIASSTPSTRIAPEKSQHIFQPPHEDALGRSLLFPEIEKLYGHGYEISTVAASRSCRYIASACRASSVDHALIRLVDVDTWLEVKPPLKAHNLTVTGLDFYPGQGTRNDEFIVSVGRDRMVVVWRREKADTGCYKLWTKVEKAHTRMILGVSWAPQESRNAASDSILFATAGRDKAIHVWSMDVKERELALGKEELQGSGRVTRRGTLNLSQPVTTIEFAPFSREQHALRDNEALKGEDAEQNKDVALAFGLEDGSVGTARIKVAADLGIQVERVDYIDNRMSPSKSVSSVAWRIKSEEEEEQKVERARVSAEAGREEAEHNWLGVASEDGSVRIFDVGLDEG